MEGWLKEALQPWRSKYIQYFRGFLGDQAIVMASIRSRKYKAYLFKVQKYKTIHKNASFIYQGTLHTQAVKKEYAKV